MYIKINEGCLTFPEFISIETRNFIKKILIVNAFDRPLSDEVIFLNIRY